MAAKYFVQKCSVLLLDNLKVGRQANLILGDRVLPKQDSVKDLEVVVDEHINHIVTRADMAANSCTSRCDVDL